MAGEDGGMRAFAGVVAAGVLVAGLFAALLRILTAVLAPLGGNPQQFGFGLVVVLCLTGCLCFLGSAVLFSIGE
ncbi:MAG TPA: hypothetical protein VGH89_25140 [Pseudonocardia sp.]|jgi:hypothetical protein